MKVYQSCVMFVLLTLSLLLGTVTSERLMNTNSYSLLLSDQGQFPDMNDMVSKQQLAIGQQVGQETEERSETEPETEVKWTTPRKRSTMLLNKLMHALQKAIDAESGLPVPGAEMSIEGQNGVTIMGPEAVAAMAITSPKDLQRRAGEGKMFWRCYFNAVSCF